MSKRRISISAIRQKFNHGWVEGKPALDLQEKEKSWWRERQLWAVQENCCQGYARIWKDKSSVPIQSQRGISKRWIDFRQERWDHCHELWDRFNQNTLQVQATTFYVTNLFLGKHKPRRVCYFNDWRLDLLEPLGWQEGGDWHRRALQYRNDQRNYLWFHRQEFLYPVQQL